MNWSNSSEIVWPTIILVSLAIIIFSSVLTIRRNKKSSLKVRNTLPKIGILLSSILFLLYAGFLMADISFQNNTKRIFGTPELAFPLEDVPKNLTHSSGEKVVVYFPMEEIYRYLYAPIDKRTLSAKNAGYLLVIFDIEDVVGRYPSHTYQHPIIGDIHMGDAKAYRHIFYTYLYDLETMQLIEEGFILGGDPPASVTTNIGEEPKSASGKRPTFEEVGHWTNSNINHSYDANSSKGKYSLERFFITIFDVAIPVAAMLLAVLLAAIEIIIFREDRKL